MPWNQDDRYKMADRGGGPFPEETLRDKQYRRECRAGESYLGLARRLLGDSEICRLRAEGPYLDSPSDPSRAEALGTDLHPPRFATAEVDLYGLKVDPPGPPGVTI